jgi:hypothetical protein
MKNIDPDKSITANIVPSRLHLTFIILFLCTLNAFTSVMPLGSKNINLTIPSENPTTNILP